MQAMADSIAALFQIEDIRISMDNQDEADKEQIALYGAANPHGKAGEMPSVSLNKQCLNCSPSNQSHLINGFKMACLHY